jgi:hypothetical protein
MKSSAIRSLVIFLMGVASAAVAGGLYQREPTTPEDFQKRATRVLVDLEWLGRYVAKADNGHVFIESSPIGQCVPVPPQPIMPEYAVDPRSLGRGISAVQAINTAFIVGDLRPVSEVEKCRG